MKNILWKVLLILGGLAICVWLIYPPEEKIRLGKDLQGGTSLLYSVKIPEGVHAETAISQVIQVLSERVNPAGVLDISFVPVGRDRIEVVMPLPGDEVKALKAALDQSLADLTAAAEIKPADLDAALEQGAAASRFGTASSGESSKIQQLQTLYTQRQDAEKALKEAEASGASAEDRMPLEQALADADVAYSDLRAQVLAQSLSRPRVMAVLGLSKVQKLDKSTGKRVTGSSPREEALSRLTADFPSLNFEKAISAYDAYTAKRRGLDEPEDLIRMLRGAGVLEFHIAVTNSDQAKPVNPQELRQQLLERGPEGTDSPVARWFPINDIRQWYEKPAQLAALEADPISYFAARDLVAAVYDNRYFVLLYVTEAKSLTHSAERSWMIERTYATSDQLGRPAVGFILDSSGGQYMGRLTGPNVNQPMAIVLDGQVYSAPNIQERIGGQGQITGSFSTEELNYLTRVLAAGSLEARLSPEPISVNTLGPTLGKENLQRGLRACVVSVIAVAAWMTIYYFLAGLFANVALLCNLLVIFGVMSFIDSTFTLPGLAGVALTMGMAVDANVLIYERIREELVTTKVDLRTAVRLGYSKAFSAIFDGHVTLLITNIILIYTATTEVKGFAVSMTIGTASSLFTALIITRLLFRIYTDVLHQTRLTMLPMVVPIVNRFMHPHIDWMRMKRVFIPLSIISIVASIAVIIGRGADFFDTEFRGGVSMTMKTAMEDSRAGQPPERRWLPQTGPNGVEERIRAIGKQAAEKTATDPAQKQRLDVIRQLAEASVLTVGNTRAEGGHIFSQTFRIKVPLPADLGEEATITDIVADSIVSEFSSDLEVTVPLTFAGAKSTDAPKEYVRPIQSEILGRNVDHPELTDSVRDAVGGVAILLEEITPPATTADILARINRLQQRSELAAEFKVYPLTPAKTGDPSGPQRAVVVTAVDPNLSLQKVDYDRWQAQLATKSWALVSEALQKKTSLEEVSSFSSAVAESLKANAVVATILSLLVILVYIWYRFGSLRYSAGAVISLFHDFICGVGALALSHWLSRTAIGSWLLIEDFHIDLNVVAAVLTLIGYSLNDTIVVLDRIRENRGKLTITTPTVVNRSINEVFGRSLMTSSTTFLSLLVLYIVGGPGIRHFAFVMLVGVIVGTYSSIAIAAPLVTKTPPRTGIDEETSTTGARVAEKDSWKSQTAAAPA